ncbi:MAG: TAXI family TRAP transporter solute-binding subunit [Synergistaceae bacterium]|nr:TAXI family TRAP transporter solute-binding subunit [Synergistaceae bacterium]
MKKLFIAIILLIFSSACNASESNWPSHLRFMSGPKGGNWATLGTALSEIFTKSGLPETISVSGAGVSNILNTHARRADFGFSVTSLLGAALKGEADFNGRAVNNAVIMTNLYTQYTYFVIRRDFAVKNKIKSLDDIIDRKISMRFATLKPGTSSEFVIKALFDKAFGIDYKKIFIEWGGSVDYYSYEAGADLLVNNIIDCFAFSVGKIAPIITSIEDRTDIILLPVSQESLNKLSDAYGTVTLEIEPGIYKSLPAGSGPVKTVGDFTCIVIRKDLPESLVYALNKSIWENKKFLSERVQDMQELTPDTALPEKVQAHEGSLKFWNEHK